MPKQMLLDKASELRDIADSLESYASEMEDEETSEGDIGMTDSEASSGDTKIKMAAAAIRKGLK